ncbi:hypothetical protein ACN47E_009887 [Coniothyrium glycines]
MRDRFAKKNDRSDENSICNVWDRAAVLAVFQQALTRITAENHKNIYLEAIRKVEIILNIRGARPTDMVFARTMLLDPLEPQYAKPRIEGEDDDYGYQASCRLQAWRKEGWPNVIPEKAIAEERKKGESLAKGDLTDEVLRDRALAWPEEDWGDEVNANNQE